MKMNFKRSTGKTLCLATLSVMAAVFATGCVQTVDYYDDGYDTEPTVIVKQARPIYREVDVYQTRPTVIYTQPEPAYHYRHRVKHYHTPHYVAPPSTTSTVILHSHHKRNKDKTFILNPGRHQQQQVTIKAPREERNTRVVKSYRNNVQSHHYNKTHKVSPPSTTEVQHSKKIVIDSHGDAPPSTLAD